MNDLILRTVVEVLEYLADPWGLDKEDEEEEPP